ncbi:hypothetical protein MFLAVUS_010461 [Mucor flavus]|uniref:Uncharacterized protein n=1 Tax=Mucor flavus TaxID=439312 RepID=A0ABP9ZCS5_9FUNG
MQEGTTAMRKKLLFVYCNRAQRDKDWNVLEEQTSKVNREKGRLEEKHNGHLINVYDYHPQARVSDAVTFLIEKFENFSLKDTSVRMYFV